MNCRQRGMKCTECRMNGIADKEKSKNVSNYYHAMARQYCNKTEMKVWRKRLLNVKNGR
jgi:hypothetical protein